MDLRFADIAVNDAALEQHGYPRHKFLSMDIAQIRHLEDQARLSADLAGLRPGLQHSGVWRHRRSVSIAVRDGGVGIPADELARVTTPFYRASTARAIPGIGLGLSGVKAIVRQHGGRLAIDSVNGEGTTVTISLPVGQRAGQPAPGTSTGTRST